MGIWKTAKPVLGQILTSKKALATIAAGIIWGLAQAGIIASPEQILPLLGVIASFVIGQGVADSGKEAKKIEVGAIKELAESSGDNSEEKPGNPSQPPFR